MSNFGTPPYLGGPSRWSRKALNKIIAEEAPGGGGGVSDHGALTGLGDDDHTQYTKKSSNLSDLTNVGTARTNLDVDQAGTDNSPSASTTTAGKVELATSTEVNTGTDATRAVTDVTDEANVSATASVIANTAKNSYPSADSTKVGFIAVTQAVDLDTMESNVATNNAKVGITPTQASNITTNNAKVSYTDASAVSANTAKVTNATHTGEVTGSGALTVGKTAVTGKSTTTAVGSDYVLLSDTSDSGNLKKALISDFASSGGDMAASTYDPATIAEQLVGLTATQTLTNKTITNPAGMDGNDVGLGNVENLSLADIIGAIFYVGFILIEHTGVNPGTTYGVGTWTLTSVGRSIVGIDSGDTDFDTAGETGGSKTVAGDPHSHTLGSAGWAALDGTDGSLRVLRKTGVSWTANIRNSSIGSYSSSGSARTRAVALGGVTNSESPSATSVVQPYQAEYVWERTA